MNLNALKLEFIKYAERMTEIRRLSSPDIHAFDSASDYSERLNYNFQRVGRLAAMNRKMLENDLFPILDSTELLEEALIDEMRRLNEVLLNVADSQSEFTNLDLPIASLISDRLLEDLKKKDDPDELIRQMDDAIAVFYSLTSMTARIFTHPEISDAYRKKGVKLGADFIGFLDKAKFLSIKDPECRDIVLTNARFMTAFYERVNGDHRVNEQNLYILDRMMAVSEDPFFGDLMPDYDWEYYRFRIMEYYVQSTEMLNDRGFDAKQLEHIGEKAAEFEALYPHYEKTMATVPGLRTIPVCIARCKYLSGRMERKEYYDLLLSLYEKREPLEFGGDGCYFNLLIPLEFICLLQQQRLSVQEMDLLRDIYKNICAYMFRMPSDGIMSFAMEFIVALVRRFIEIPSGMSMKDFVLSIIAAIHPPTYIHSMMVGLITQCLCSHLLEYRPELFIGICGAVSAEDVKKKSPLILNFAYNAALCHDFGKVDIIDTIFVYGRKLLDFEFDIIKSHPDTGYVLLKSNPSTAEYAEVALLHHKWYDDSAGYPADKKSSDSIYKTIIDIVQCADCLDAATDTVGRSYNRGKKLEDFIDELREGSGTRYAPWMSDLFDKPGVREDVEYLLLSGRQKKYRDTFILLRDVQEKNEADGM